MHPQELRKHRLIQINKILTNFKNLPPPLQTQKYKKYLLDTKELLKPVLREITVPFSKVGKIIGPGGSVLKNIEKDYKCKITIDSSSKISSIINIEGDDADLVVKHIEDVFCNTKKHFNIDEMSDWEKFYVWWAYYNKKNV